MVDAPDELVRFLEVAYQAHEALWAKVAEGYPEVTSGDMAPGDIDALELALLQTMQVWLWNNHPDRELAEEITGWKVEWMDISWHPEPANISRRVWSECSGLPS